MRASRGIIIGLQALAKALLAIGWWCWQAALLWTSYSRVARDSSAALDSRRRGNDERGGGWAPGIVLTPRFKRSATGFAAAAASCRRGSRMRGWIGRLNRSAPVRATCRGAAALKACAV